MCIRDSFAAGNVSRGGNVPSGEERGETDVFAGYRQTRKAVIQIISKLREVNYVMIFCIYVKTAID